jgi:kynureninase
LARCRAACAQSFKQFADEWDQRGVRAWHEGWWELGKTTGNLLAPILGVPEDTITMHQNVSVSPVARDVVFDFPASAGRS